VGAGLPAIAVDHSTLMLADLTPSLASQLPQGFAVKTQITESTKGSRSSPLILSSRALFYY
jgi:hypothetical protein